MADVAVENKETPVVEEVAMAKKIDAVATENGIIDTAANAEDVTVEAKENGSSDVAKAAVIAADILPTATAAAPIVPDAVVDSKMKDKIDATSAAVSGTNEASAIVSSADKVDAVATAASATDAKTDESMATDEVNVAEKSNGNKKDDVDMAEAEPTEETNGDSSTDSPAEAVKRKLTASEVDAKVDEAATATAEKKAKLEEAKEDVTNGGGDPTEIAA